MEEIASHFNIEPEDQQLQWEDFCQLMNSKKKDQRTMDSIIKDFKREDTSLITPNSFIYKQLSTALYFHCLLPRQREYFQSLN
ncbi:hypothetical protein DPMN_124735 [Dreissena polymorpha]|uniref:Uncharacterized protein n=1 Tax=Dreissena polymorpha TaxID=45954 RepID=A0A9D4GWW1_DREPO|nr:hypothetical protein DPMN_124735 [Dreissena polymorpha]